MAHVDALSRNPTIESHSSKERCILDVLQVEMKDWIATVQGADDEIKRIKEILENRETEYIADIHKNYKLKGDYMYKLIDGKTKWVVPKGVRWQILRMNHDNAGHFGFEKTLSRNHFGFQRCVDLRRNICQHASSVHIIRHLRVLRRVYFM